jgi:hypothetical protein
MENYIHVVLFVCTAVWLPLIFMILLFTGLYMAIVFRRSIETPFFYLVKVWNLIVGLFIVLLALGMVTDRDETGFNAFLKEYLPMIPETALASGVAFMLIVSCTLYCMGILGCKLIAISLQESK